MTDNVNIINYVIQFLNDNGYGEIAQKVQSESGNELYSEQYREIVALCKEDFNKEKFMQYINKIYGEEVIKNKNEFIVKIYNRMFMFALYNIFPESDKKDILKLMQEHLKRMLSMKEIDSSIGEEIKKNENIFKIIFTGNRDLLIDNFPEIKDKNSFLNFIINTYHFIKLKHNSTLSKLLFSLYENSLKKCKYHNCQISPSDNSSLFTQLNNHRCSSSLIPSKPSLVLDEKQEVCNIVLSNSCKYFIAVLSNFTLKTFQISPISKSIDIIQLKSFSSNHSAMITSLSWNSSDTLIMTSSKDKTIRILDPFSGSTKKKFTTLHDAMISCSIFINDDLICSCGMDYRVNLACLSTAQKKQSLSVPGVTISELLYSIHYKTIIVVSATNNSVMFYDDNLTTVLNTHQLNDVIVSCSISKTDKGKYMLVNSSKATPMIELIDVSSFTVIGKYFGHRQDKFNIKCSFGGINENFIVCGSQNAKVYLWSRTQSIPVSVVKTHVASVNSAIWPYAISSDIVLSCSDDHNIIVIANEKIDKVYYNYGNNTEGKIVNIDIDNSRNSTSVLPQNQINAGNVTRIINNIRYMLNHIGYASDEEEEDSN